MDRDPFAPLSSDEAASGHDAGPAPAGEIEALPSPAGTIPPDDHPKLGRVTRRWAYYGADDALEGYICRFETPNGKEYRPQRYGSLNGRTGWHWKGWPGGGRPLYRRRELVAAPTLPVLITEGEKAADGAHRLLGSASAADVPELGPLIAVAPMGGANSPQLTDYSAVASRAVWVWPDNDGPGRRFAQTAVDLVLQAGATSVRIAALPADTPSGWDLGDPLPKGWTLGTIRAALLEPQEEIQGNFRVVFRHGGPWAPGLYRRDTRQIAGEAVEEWVWFGSPITIAADSRNGQGEAWGRLLVVLDRDGVTHSWAMPMALMAGAGDEYRRELLHRGFVLQPTPAARKWLAEYLVMWQPSVRVRCVERIGWHGSTFVLPERTYGADAGERTVLQTGGAVPQLKLMGTLAGWQREIGAHACGNTRLVMAISTAFAAPLAHLVGEESGGFHLMGASSIGKTAALHAARSVWGTELVSWRTTDNGAEALARDHCDLLLTLDEIGQADPRVVEALAYLLGNQRGKARMARDITLRASLTWRVLFLSSGERSLAACLNEIGKRAMAGQMVRVLELPADAGAGFGLFENLHGISGPATFAEELRLAADRQAGHAGRALLDGLVQHYHDCREKLRQSRQHFIEAHCPPASAGQVKRACGRLGLVAAAGELVSALGIVPWPPGEAERALLCCFRDWLNQRGGTAPAEIINGMRQVRLFLEQHGSSRFEAAWGADWGFSAAEPRTVNRAGFRRRDALGYWTYFILPSVWAAEVCKGYDPGLIARAMAERDYLVRGDGKNLSRKERVPGHELTRYYVVAAKFLASSDDADVAG